MKEAYLAELERRLIAFFEDQAQGLDIPPALLYRLEGFIEAGQLCEWLQESTLKAQLVALAEQHLNAEAAERYRHDHRVILHLQMPEAPVHPNTRER